MEGLISLYCQGDSFTVRLCSVFTLCISFILYEKLQLHLFQLCQFNHVTIDYTEGQDVTQLLRPVFLPRCSFVLDISNNKLLILFIGFILNLFIGLLWLWLFNHVCALVCSIEGLRRPAVKLHMVP